MVTIVVGGQFGSECKGAVCARLHRETPEMVGVRVGGSQAGHTVVDGKGRTWALRHVPVAAVVDPESVLVIAEGSEIDLNVLEMEIQKLELAGFAVRERLLVDPEATVIEDRHKAIEADISTGSTHKGVGAARADRALRRCRRMGDLEPQGITLVQTGGWLRQRESQSLPTLIEGVQGYGLGSHAGYWPHVTSGDCRAQDFLAMAGLTTKSYTEVWLTVRPYPIRIAGNSGPLQGETSWAMLGLAPEQTTVTRKTRRVGAWDRDLVLKAIDANEPDYVALMQFDYVFRHLHGETEMAGGTDAAAWVTGLERELGVPVGMLGTGPATQIMRIRNQEDM